MKAEISKSSQKGSKLTLFSFWLKFRPLFLHDYVAIPIIFSTAEGGKICARGIYQKEDERIIFCSKEDSRLGSADQLNPLRLIGLSESPNLLLMLISRERPFEILKFSLFWNPYCLIFPIQPVFSIWKIKKYQPFFFFAGSPPIEISKIEPKLWFSV